MSCGCNKNEPEKQSSPPVANNKNTNITTSDKIKKLRIKIKGDQKDKYKSKGDIF